MTEVAFINPAHVAFLMKEGKPLLMLPVSYPEGCEGRAWRVTITDKTVSVDCGGVASFLVGLYGDNIEPDMHWWERVEIEDTCLIGFANGTIVDPDIEYR